MNGAEGIEGTIVNMMRSAVTTLPDDVIRALKKARENEDLPIARTQIDTILRNIERGSELALPMCQDTGLHVFFVTGRYSKDIVDAIYTGVERATSEIPLRPNAVHPITRKNSGTNCHRRTSPHNL